MLILLALGIFVGSRAVTLAQKIFDKSDGGTFFSQLFIAKDARLAGEDEGEVRILLLGVGGAGHDGGTLTDTMILATIRLADETDNRPRVSLVSIPRDLNVYIPGYEWRKINSAYAFGEIGGSQGPKLATEAAEGLLGKNIPYYAVINFDGFRTIVNELGGIYVEVPAGFTDAQFPDQNYGYLEPVVFEAGRQKMDGERALQYVRSRHGDNNQGSDFARAKRQQRITQAIADEIASVRILSNFNLIGRIIDAATNNFRTNLELHEIKRLYEIGQKVESQNVSSISLDGASGLVCDDIIEETGAYILLPCEGLGKYDKIQDAINDQFVIGFTNEENPSIEIQNATKIPGLGLEAAVYLQLQNATIETANYKGEAEFLETVIYDNTGGAKPKTLRYLKEKLAGTVAASVYPFPTSSKNPDFVVVVTQKIQDLIK